MAAAPADWYLRTLLPPHARPASIRMGPGQFIVGRLAGLDLTLNSGYVSERHAEFSVTDDRVYVTDLGSRNGTYVNGKRIRRAQIGVGDLLLIGDVRFRLDRRPAEQTGAMSPYCPEHPHQLHWLSQQFDQLFDEESVTALLQPVVRLTDGARIGYRVILQSTVAGLESEADILAAAEALGREDDLFPRLLRWRARAGSGIGRSGFVCIDAPCGINVDVELDPILEAIRSELPATTIHLTFEDLHAYSLPVLSRLGELLQQHGVGLVLRRFTREQLRLLQGFRLLPQWVQLEPALRLSVAGKETGSNLQVKALCDQLHHYGIQVALGNIATLEELKLATQADVDLAEGPIFGEPLRLQRIPRTDILTPSQVAALLEDTPAEVDAQTAAIGAT